MVFSSLTKTQICSISRTVCYLDEQV